LKITRTEAIKVHIPYLESLREEILEGYRKENLPPNHLLRWVVKIHTDAGLVGVGEAVLDPGPHLASLQGRSVWELVHDVSIGPAATIAIYDLAAQAAGLPVSRLFSPRPRATIQQIWWSRSLSPKLMQAEAKRGVEAGYRVHKFKARPYEDLVEQVAAMVEVVPPDYELLADANSSFVTPERTLALAQALKGYSQFKGFEEPIPHVDTVGYRRIRASLPFRLAVHWEAVDTRTFIFESLNDAFVVEDWLWGPPLIQKSALCALGGQKLWVEGGLYSGISQAFQAHMAAALPNVEYTISVTHIVEDDLVNEPFVVAKGGFYKVPTKPGLGITLDEKAVEKYRVA
jgi:L-alanine-DL-glutamate epimerase-like enolase superfamily enzyme